MNKNKIKRQIEDCLKRQISINTNINKIKNIQENKVTVSLNYFIPKIIFDDSLKKQYIKFIRLSSFYDATFKLDSKGIRPLFDKNFLYKKIHSDLNRHEKLIEDLILDKIYPNLVKIPLIKNQLTPIYTILLEIITNNHITKEELCRMRRQDKVKRYISFLEGLQIIKKDKNGNYVEGNIPISLKHKLQKTEKGKLLDDNVKEEVLACTFGYALKEGKKYLLEELKLTAITPFLRIAVFYYSLASQIKNLNKMTRKTFFEVYTAQNPNVKVISSQLNNHLQDMVNAGILKKQHSFFFGKKDILDAIS